jgi:DNA-binding NtrC family response regulator
MSFTVNCGAIPEELLTVNYLVMKRAFTDNFTREEAILRNLQSGGTIF